MNITTRAASSDSCIDIATEEGFSKLVAHSTNLGISPDEMTSFMRHFRNSLATDPWTAGIEISSKVFSEMFSEAMADYFSDSENPEEQLVEVDQEEEDDKFSFTVDIATDEDGNVTSPNFYMVGAKPYDHKPTTFDATVYECCTLAGGGKERRLKGTKRKAGGNRKKRAAKMARSSGGNPRPVRDDEIACYYEVDLTTTASGTIDANLCVNSPTQAYNNAGTLDKAGEISRISEGYSVCEHYTHVDQEAPLVQRSGYFIMAYDPDSIPPPTSLTEREVQQFGYRKKMNAGDKVIDFMVIPKKLSAGEYTPLGADPSIATVREKGIYDWGSPMSNGYVYFKYVGGPASTRIGKLKVWAFYKMHYPRYIPSTLRDAMYPIPALPSTVPVSLPSPPPVDLGLWTDDDERELNRLKDKKLLSL